MDKQTRFNAKVLKMEWQENCMKEIRTLNELRVKAFDNLMEHIQNNPSAMLNRRILLRQEKFYRYCYNCDYEKAVEYLAKYQQSVGLFLEEMNDEVLEGDQRNVLLGVVDTDWENTNVKDLKTNEGSYKTICDTYMDTYNLMSSFYKSMPMELWETFKNL